MADEITTGVPNAWADAVSAKAREFLECCTYHKGEFMDIENIIVDVDYPALVQIRDLSDRMRTCPQIQVTVIARITR